MNPEEMGRRRYRFGAERAWTADSERRFIRQALAAFPGSFEIDRDGNAVELEQLTFEE